MIEVQISIIGISFIVFSLLVFGLLRVFKRQDIAPFFILPVFLFCLGFALRLLGNKSFIDVGFFFTESAFLVIYIIFSISFLLGQLKYWRL